MSNMISREEVERISEIARLELSVAEKEQFQKDISKRIDYIDQIKSVKIIPLEKDLVNINSMRADEITNSPDEFTADIVREMPESEDRFLKIHKILADNE